MEPPLMSRRLTSLVQRSVGTDNSQIRFHRKRLHPIVRAAENNRRRKDACRCTPALQSLGRIPLIFLTRSLAQRERIAPANEWLHCIFQCNASGQNAKSPVPDDGWRMTPKKPDE
jgi:hypothetical protein